ncbi:MAG: helix-turn-helix transcriptional regulator [Bacteroidales bacterium]|nr:helix-turn-helix transcriptional regulator [Bacteroidales bacterium]
MTDREREILPLLAAELTSPQIADKLYLSLPTIKWYRRRLLDHFDAKNTSEMVAKAKELGLL